MAEFAISLFVSTVADRLSKFLIHESAVLRGVTKQVEWLERELRLMQVTLKHVRDQGRSIDWEQDLEDVARDAKDVIETFVIKSVKRRRIAVLSWLDRYKVGKDLEKISARMRDMREKAPESMTVTVETPGSGERETSSASGTATTIVAPALEKLGHILTQNLITRDKVIEVIERVRDELGEVQNILCNLKATTEREEVWLKEVKKVCDYTTGVAGNFIGRRERWLKMGRLEQVFSPWAGGCASEREFMKQMKYVRTQIGDAFCRSLTYGVGGEEDKSDKIGTRSSPVPSLSLELLIIAKLPFFIYFFFLFPFLDIWPEYLLFVVCYEVFVCRTPAPEHKGEAKDNKMTRTFKNLMLFVSIDFVIFILFLLLDFDFGIFLELSSLLYTVIVWLVSLWSAMDKNLKSAQRDLALMGALFNDIAECQNERQKVWVNQLRLVAQKGNSLISEYGTGSCLRRTRFAKNINSLLNEILNISDRKTIYSIPNIRGRERLGPSIQNESESEHPPAPAPAPAAASYQSLKRLEKKIQSIREEKQLMDALFQDVDEMGELEARSRVWVDEMRAIAGEIERVINEYAIKLEHKPIHIRILNYRTQIVIERKIDQIRDKIKETLRRRKAYGLVQLQTRAESLSMVQILRRRMQPSLFLRESKFVGFDEDAEALMAQLVSDEKRRCITSIVGIQGTGKTILARLIFDHKVVVDHFVCRVWVSVPPNCTTFERLQEEIAKEAAPQIMEGQQDILRTLASTRYLMVIDNVETSQLLDALEKAIPDMSTASRLLLTSRNAKVVQHAGAKTFVHPLQLLDDENSWMLFTKNLEVGIPPKLVNIGKEIVIKCGGLPSRILKMSHSLPKGDVSEEKWRRKLEQLNQYQEPWFDMRNTINMSLPLYLRRYLSYFALFPDEFEIPARRLVVLWVAEGLVHHGEDEEPPEKIAERYLTELIDLNMVQIAKRKPNGKVKTCRITHALRQHMLEKDNESSNTTIHSNANESSNTAIHSDANESSNTAIGSDANESSNTAIGSDANEPSNTAIGSDANESSNTAIHSDANESSNTAIHSDANESSNTAIGSDANESSNTAIGSDANTTNSIIRQVADHFNVEDVWHGHIHGNTTSDSATLRIYYKHVLSFLSFDAQEGSKPGQDIGIFLERCISSNCFLQLRVLDLERLFKPQLPRNISKLSRLRYLGLRWTYLESLPSSISSLLKLQTLDLKHTYIHTLPSSIWKMELRHLFLSETYRSKFPPKPKGSQSLSELQTLWGLFVDEETPVKGGLDKLVNIKRLGLACQSMSLEQEKMKMQLDAVADWLMKLEYLQSLRLKSRDEEGRPWNLHLKSLENHMNLTDMYLLGTLSSASILSQFPPNLIELTLSHSKLEDDPMQLLKDLPSLQSLSLLAESYTGKVLVCSSGSFRQLRVLKIWMLEQLEEWNIEQEALSSLRQLEIRSCRCMRMLPHGLKHVNTLLELKLTNMPMQINIDKHNIPPNCQVR